MRNQCRPCGGLCSGWHQLLICLFAFCFLCLSCIRGRRSAWLPVDSPQVICRSMKRKQLQLVEAGSFTGFAPGGSVWIYGCRPWSTRLCICSKMQHVWLPLNPLQIFPETKVRMGETDLLTAFNLLQTLVSSKWAWKRECICLQGGVVP